MTTQNHELAPKRPRIRSVLRHGLRRRCPRCGEGPLFRRGITPHERCSACNLLYQRDYGDTLAFMIITDRVPILIGIAAVYLGFRSTTMPVAFAFLIAMVIPLLATIRERQGLALALDYLSRVQVPDPSDEIHRS
jgi:uncharacterized protein (DUF983 family)